MSEPIEQPKKLKRQARMVGEGFTWNPLSKHRNMICICGSERKVKRCCGMIPVVPVDVAEKIRDALKNERS